MNKGYILQRVLRKALVFAMLAVTLLAIDMQAQIIRPEIPRLSLTGNEGGYNQAFYPDGRMWVTASGDPSLYNNNGPRYILVPVFMKNCWASKSPYTAAPIYSFNFKLQYDSTALKPVGVLTRGPWLEGSHPNVRYVKGDSASLADGWQITWDEARDTTYQVQSGLITTTNPNKYRGKRVRIAAQSPRPLPLTGDPRNQDCNGFSYMPLLYVRFEVVGRPGLGVSDVTPMIITPDSIYYNKLNAALESPFPGDINYPAPPPLDKVLAGIDYDRLGFEPAAVNNIRKGMIYVHVREAGRFDFLPKPTGNPNEVSVVNVDDKDTLFQLRRVVPFDPILQQSLGQARAGIQVTLKPDGVRATNVTIESDAPWLKFQTKGTKNPIPAPTRFGRIAYIDKGILGPPTGLGYPDAQNANLPAAIDPLLNLDIICDPAGLTDDPGNTPAVDYAGRYVGYITFKSDVADIAPVRLKVVFLYIRTPDEAYDGVPPGDDWAKGMQIIVRNSAPIPQSSKLMFGTGYRATRAADSLFGEFAYDVAAPSGLYARWFAIDSAGLGPNYFEWSNGLGDFTGVFSSRDVRDITEEKTLIYRCRFNAGGSNNYPVVITWDPNQFPAGAQLYLRDIDNGKLFGLDMRTATQNPDGTRSYTIRDEKITAFDIEYTPARATRTSDLEKGWNFVSLPVRPSNNDYRQVYPNAQGTTPIKFSMDIYQAEEQLRVGTGYFIRFPRKETITISGILVTRIDKDLYPVHVYGGWNTVGSLSVPVTVDKMDFQALNNQTPAPQRLSGVFTYLTNQGYREVSQIDPGKGYFVKLNGEGFYKIQADVTKSSEGVTKGDVLASCASVTVRDNSERENVLFLTEGRNNIDVNQFELPPTPPMDWFDARFSNNSYVESGDNATLRFQGVTYPVSLTFNNNKATYTVVEPLTGNVIGQVNNGNGKVVINNERISNVRILVSNTEAGNYDITASPNPTVGVAHVSFTLPETQNVTVKVFNTMGQEIATLVNGVVSKGSTTVDFDGSNVAEGTYLVKLVAGDFVAVRKVNIVR